MQKKYLSIRTREFAWRHLRSFSQAMNKGKTIFAQLMSLFTENEFSKCISHYKGDWNAIKFNFRNRFLEMNFALFKD